MIRQTPFVRAGKGKCIRGKKEKTPVNFVGFKENEARRLKIRLEKPSGLVKRHFGNIVEEVLDLMTTGDKA